MLVVSSSIVQLVLSLWVVIFQLYKPKSLKYQLITQNTGPRDILNATMKVNNAIIVRIYKVKVLSSLVSWVLSKA
jgi:hypothetical protein